MNDYTAKDLNEPEDGDTRGDDADNIDKRAFDEMNSQVSVAYPYMLLFILS